MKTFITILFGAIILYSCQFGNGNSPFDIPEQGITFHRVNLVCGAATDIGCGSRSKPILRDLEKQSSINEAWLNRSGTVVAVVWNNVSEPNTTVVPEIFNDHGSNITTLDGNAYVGQLSDFNNGEWYKGDQVDELSMEEAGRIAGDILNPLVEDGILSKENLPKMFSEVEKYIQNQFMALEDVKLLSTTAYYDQWEDDIQKIAEKYINKSEIPDIELCGSFSFSSWLSSVFN